MLPFSPTTRIISAALVIFGFAPSIFGQKRASKPAVADSMSEMPQVLVAPLFIETAGFTGTITTLSNG